MLVDPNLATPQRIWLVRSSIEDGRREERITADGWQRLKDGENSRQEAEE